MITEKQLLKKYKIEDFHQKWEPMDDWFMVEIYRHVKGMLPPSDDLSVSWACDFLDMAHKDPKYFFGLECHGSLYTTAKRIVFRYSDLIVEELNEQ